MSQTRRVCLLYLGRRGGGAKYSAYLAQQLKINFSDQYVSVGLRRDIENIEEFDRFNPVFLLNEGYSLKSFIQIIKFLVRPELLMTELRIKSGDLCLIPMISPIGLWLEKALFNRGVVIYRVLHDAQRHPGDYWPLNHTLKRIIERSEALITLSGSVSKQVQSINPQVRIIELRHPVFNFEEDSSELNIYGNYVLFIGRIRKYKGVDNLLSAFHSLKDPSFNLVIAGSGKLPEINDSRIIVINHWLRESEISKLVRNAQLVIFPYLEASQSGLLPYCVSKNKPLLITPIAGLKEQVVDYANAWISDDVTSNALAKSITEAWGRIVGNNSRETTPNSDIDELRKLRLLIED